MHIGDVETSKHHQHILLSKEWMFSVNLNVISMSVYYIPQSLVSGHWLFNNISTLSVLKFRRTFGTAGKLPFRHRKCIESHISGLFKLLRDWLLRTVQSCCTTLVPKGVVLKMRGREWGRCLKMS